MGQVAYKIVDLFGNETLKFANRKKENKKTLFDDYDGFVDKFETKLTTDDCYTPAPVYNAVLGYVGQTVDLACLEIIRPFYPGGDFESIEYPDNAIVIDNPPFSIITKITRFYIERGIKFFLFAPHLTLFGADLDCTAIVAGASVVYENGAVVLTSFLSNLYGDVRAMTAPELHKKLEDINLSKKANLPKYKYPTNIATVTHLTHLVKHGIDFSIKKKDCMHIRELDAQRVHKKGLFGSGLLISEKAAAEKAAAEKDFAIVWELSNKERALIAQLGK